MLIECGAMFAFVYAAGLIGVVGNRLGLWSSWLMCIAGGFTGALIIGLGYTAPSGTKGFITAVLAAALAVAYHWISNEATRPSESTVQLDR